MKDVLFLPADEVLIVCGIDQYRQFDTSDHYWVLERGLHVLCFYLVVVTFCMACMIA